MQHVPTPRQTAHYSLIAKCLHWGFILLFVYGIVKQVDDVSQLADSAFLRFEMVFAVIFLLVLAARFAYMKTTQSSALPGDAPLWQHRAARAVHYGMYASLAAIALSGMLIGLLYGAGLTSGLILEAALEVHGLTVLVSYWLIAIHVAAALYHRWQTDGVWNTMVPFWKETSL